MCKNIQIVAAVYYFVIEIQDASKSSLQICTLPYLILYCSEEAKAELLRKAKNLKSMKEGGLDKVFIYPDLTPKQREVRKKLVAELKSRQSQGESGLIIVGTKIVKRRTS